MSDLMDKLLSGTLEEQKEAVVELTEERLKRKLGGVQDVPLELEYIVTEVAVARFNRIGSEGLSSHNVGGESMAWSDDDFRPYESDIQAYLNEQAGNSRGVIRFL